MLLTQNTFILSLVTPSATHEPSKAKLRELVSLTVEAFLAELPPEVAACLPVSRALGFSLVVSAAAEDKMKLATSVSDVVTAIPAGTHVLDMETNSDGVYRYDILEVRGEWEPGEISLLVTYPTDAIPDNLRPRD